MVLSKPDLGIIGGAGPMAGALLFEEIISIFQKKYGCSTDDEFPYISLLSYPFADTFLDPHGNQLVKEQLDHCFSSLAGQGTQLAVIACNTLHAFVGETHGITLIHMLKEIADAVKKAPLSSSLVIGSMTSKNNNLHGQYFPCVYPDIGLQQEIYDWMNQILAGEVKESDARALVERLNTALPLMKKEKNDKVGVVLGCTEFSFLNSRYPFYSLGLKKEYSLIDGLQLVAERAVDLMRSSK